MGQTTADVYDVCLGKLPNLVHPRPLDFKVARSPSKPRFVVARITVLKTHYSLFPVFGGLYPFVYVSETCAKLRNSPIALSLII